eukprot:scaffold3720_cov401-Prasinococcus_capsulatus_cf.AAC.11
MYQSWKVWLSANDLMVPPMMRTMFRTISPRMPYSTVCPYGWPPCRPPSTSSHMARRLRQPRESSLWEKPWPLACTAPRKKCSILGRVPAPPSG